jgi:hypothetical protein
MMHAPQEQAKSAGRWRAWSGLCALGCLLLSTLLTTCTDPLNAPSPQGYTAKGDVLRPTYRITTDDVLVKWRRVSAAQGGVSYYELRRFTGRSPDGEPLDLQRTVVAATDTQCVNVLDLVRTTYHYFVLPFRVANGDTLQGDSVHSDSVVGGSGVGFTINDGASSITKPNCTLMLRNRAGLVRNVRYTQKVQRYFKKGSGAVPVSTYSTYRFTPADRTAMTAAGYWNPANRTINDTVTASTTPLFDLNDAANPSRGPFTLTSADTFVTTAWVLDTGKEDKIVFAQVTVDTGTPPRTGTVLDTLSYGMPIAPYRVRPRLENKKMTFTANADPSLESRSGASDATMIYRHTEGSQGLTATDDYILSGKLLQFTLRIDVDSSIDSAFEYWLVVPTRIATFLGTDGPPDAAASYWLETAHRQAALTGTGPAHNEDSVYTYSIDPATAEGQQNLSQFRVIPTSAAYPSAGYPYADYDPAPITGLVPDSAYRLLTGLDRNQLYAYGKKEFMLVFHFRGRYFHEDRYVLMSRSQAGESGYIYGENATLSSGLSRTISTRTYFDFYPPAINFTSVVDTLYLNNGDTVRSIFDFALDNASAEDKGLARITELKLIVAHCPANGTILSDNRTVWNDATWNYPTWTANTQLPVSLTDLQAERVVEIPYPVHMPWRVINGVAWRGIDPSEWKSGKYFIGVVSKDEYGQEGFAPVAFQPATFSTNPFIVTVLSGK